MRRVLLINMMLFTLDVMLKEKIEYCSFYFKYPHDLYILTTSSKSNESISNSIACLKSTASNALYLALSLFNLCNKALKTSSVGLSSGEYGGNATNLMPYKSQSASGNPMLSP